MGRYSVRQAPTKEAPKGPHPIWNGLGCLMLVIVPLISIGISVMVMNIVEANQWPFPKQLLGYPSLPDFLFSTNALASIFGVVRSVRNLYAYIALTLLISMILGGFVSFLYSLVYRLVGPSKYGPTDAPPVKLKVTKKQR